MVFVFLCTGNALISTYASIKNVQKMVFFVKNLKQKDIDIYVNNALNKNTLMFEPIIRKMLKVDYTKSKTVGELSNFMRTLYNPKSSKKLFLAENTSLSEIPTSSKFHKTL